MMYRCENCGHLFEEGEQARWTEEHGEEWAGCPLCRGGYEEVHQCKECDEWHTENELYDGWCEKCLRETINYDTFFEYCEANKDENYLDIFVMSEFLDMDMPKHSSYDFHQLMIEVYKERVSWVKMYPETKVYDFLASCIRFIMDDDGSIGRENYADWLNKRGGKEMRLYSYTYTFKGGKITVRAMNAEMGKILAQAEAIKRGWDYEIITN